MTYFRRRVEMETLWRVPPPKVGDRVWRVAVHVHEHLLHRVVEDVQLGIRHDRAGGGEGRSFFRCFPPAHHQG